MPKGPRRPRVGWADYVRQVVNRKGLTSRQVQQRAARRGKTFPNSYLARIIAGRVPNPTLKTVEALAAGLDVDHAELLMVAAGIDHKSELDAFKDSAAYRLWLRQQEAEPEKREWVDQILDAMLPD